MSQTALGFLTVIAALTVLRLVAAAVLPLSADEAYYWLWSRHLAAGYYDHPPAIAYAIRLGTLAFGDTPLGVRVGPILLSLIASAFVWRGAAIFLRDEDAAARACLFFNLTLMVSVETLAASPDAPSIAAASAVFYALAKIDETGKGVWWLAVGLASGLALLSKYTGFFLGAGILVWLLLSPKARRHLLTLWPYLGGAVALIVFLPNLVWNSQHGWMTFAFQFGRIGGGGFTLRFLFEFLGAQLLLASPFIFALAALQLAFSARDRDSPTFMLAALIFPSALYFLIHSLHDRVQGNWPSFLYPALAIAAAGGWMRSDWSGWTAPVWRVSRRLAAPVALVLLIAVYVQALFAVVPFGRSDPLARLLAIGFDGVTRSVEQARAQTGAAAVLTTDYETTSWLAFYLPHTVPVVQVNETQRYLEAPVPSATLLSKPLLYVVEQRLDKHALLAPDFTAIQPVLRFDRRREGVPVAHYIVYRVTGWRGTALGRQL